MYTIKKEFTFCASHNLECLAPEHPCSRIHGHNYQVIVELKSETLNEAGFVTDYRELDTIKDWINTVLDHQHLNDQIPVNPTAENIAHYLFKVFKEAYPQLSAITVQETPKTSARYEPTIN